MNAGGGGNMNNWPALAGLCCFVNGKSVGRLIVRHSWPKPDAAAGASSD